MAKQRETQAMKISKLPMEDIMRLSGAEGRKKLEAYVRTLRSSYKRRVLSFRKNNLVSHAQISLEATLPRESQVPLTKMSRNQLLLEFFRYAKFFNDKTSTEQGIKRVNSEQDIRLFGKNSRGRPKRTMTNREREDFWSIYDEFRNQFPEWTALPFSEDEQKAIAEAMFTDDGFSKLTLTQKLERVRDILIQRQIKQNLEDTPNAFAGRGPMFDF